ncbi:SDR family oxidoreductase [Priestia aryabhattai]|uniref:SDR family NAD(P)-dependent oxidoreductase n=1 Tax=Priestia TaxID=2800373 RepID=UPI001EC5BA0F|nr:MULTISPECIES: SDR family oxidoreductase [Priestia]MBY0093545.1 SDR family oxidoreductase [Priestia aryabhattai]MBY0104830.1 SDR family oxidoreductase [Priestia aryabhattai]MCM3305706.1 SDR family oxidoreductase [Priestia megaterium]
MSQHYALITGAWGGIGKELAYQFAKDEHPVILVARSADKLAAIGENLKSTYNIEVITIVKDLSREEEIQSLYEELKNKKMHVDYLVNNAGFRLYGKFIETALDEELNMIDLNIRALTHLTKLFLPDMVKRNRGKILNIASVAAFMPGPLMTVYYATKAYVLSFTEALENELRGINVTVSALCPGPTKTGFSDRAQLSNSKLFQSGAMDVETVTKVGYKKFMKGQTVIVPGVQFRLATFIPRFVPRKWLTSVVRRTQEIK